jgi:signal transduction histidine kinase
MRPVDAEDAQLRAERRRRHDTVGEVAAAVARELQTPVHGISSAAQLLRFRVHDDPVLERNLGRIVREVERLNRLVAELLDFGRPTLPRLATRDPDAVWDGVLESARGPLESKSLLVQRERAHPAAHCRLDAELLAQAFRHVLANAIDAAPDASDLTLASATQPDGSWRCTLRNAGAPLADETRDRAFDVFYTTKPGGIGLGLALCQRIVDLHGGSIVLENAQPEGVVLTITLPTT